MKENEAESLVVSCCTHIITNAAEIAKAASEISEQVEIKDELISKIADCTAAIDSIAPALLNFRDAVNRLKKINGELRKGTRPVKIK